MDALADIGMVTAWESVKTGGRLEAFTPDKPGLLSHGPF
jgi:hypothetical protein